MKISQVKALPVLKIPEFFMMLVMSGLMAPSGFCHEDMEVAFLNPTHEGDMFWDMVTYSMKAVADDLGIKLVVHYNDSRNRFGEKELAEKILKSENKPDYFISQVKRNNFPFMLKLAEESKVRYFSINTSVPEGESHQIGRPRENYSRWIGQLVPNDYQAGFDLAETLITVAKNRNKGGAEGIDVLAISGGRDTTAALERNKGLMAALRKHDNVRLKQLVFTEWRIDEAYRVSARLFERHPATSVVWGASDGIAIAAVKALMESPVKEPGNVIAGGIDWSAEGLEAVRQGRLAATVGGHFMEGGWAMILLHDYHHGIDFSKELGTVIQTDFLALTKQNLSKFQGLLEHDKLNAVDFRKYSKVHNPDLKNYRFDLEGLAERMPEH